MAIRKYVAPTTREAMLQVRRELGDDAVIIANRRIGNRIEILAAPPDTVDALVERSEGRTEARGDVRSEPRVEQRGGAAARDMNPPAERGAARAEVRPKVEAFQDFVRRQMNAAAEPAPARPARELPSRAPAAPNAQRPAGNNALAMYRDVADTYDDELPSGDRADGSDRGDRGDGARGDFGERHFARAPRDERIERAMRDERDERSAVEAARRSPRATTLPLSHRAPQIESTMQLDPAVFRRRPAQVAAEPPRAPSVRPPVDIVLDAAPAPAALPAAKPAMPAAAMAPVPATPAEPAAPIASGHATVPSMPMRSQAAPIATAARLREASLKTRAAQLAAAQAAAARAAATQADGPTAAAPAATQESAVPPVAAAAVPVAQATAAEATAERTVVAASLPAQASTTPTSAAPALAAAAAAAEAGATSAAAAGAATPHTAPPAASTPAATPLSTQSPATPLFAPVPPLTSVAIVGVPVDPMALALANAPRARASEPVPARALPAAAAVSPEATTAPVVQTAPIAPVALAIETPSLAAQVTTLDVPFTARWVAATRGVPAAPAAAQPPPQPAASVPAEAVSAAPAAPVVEPAAPPTADAAAPAAERALLAELQSMRDMLREQLASLASRSAAASAEATAESAPVADPAPAVSPSSAAPAIASNTAMARVMTRLVTAGFSADVSRRIAANVPAGTDATQAEAWLRDLLAHNLRCIDPADGLVERAGRPGATGQVFALIGPTGVGKTTTVAKLAARFAVRHGTSALGLITLDAYRVAAPEQLRAYGRILGTPVHLAQDAATLRELLATMVHKRLVLIDTCGVSQRDERLAEMLDLLAAAGSATRPVQRVLLLNSASHAETLDDAARAWRGSECVGAILTKLDEAARIGGSLDAVLRHKLTLLGLTNGQRVPEDWHPANGRLLAHLALKPAAQLFDLADEEAAALIEPVGAAAAGAQG